MHAIRQIVLKGRISTLQSERYHPYSLSDGGGWSKMKVFGIQSVNSEGIVTKFCNHYYVVIWQQP